MIYSIELFDQKKDMTITIKNIPKTFVLVCADNENVEILFTTQYYLYAVYEKLEICGLKFMITKNTKKNITLLNIS